ncbi:cytoplasmic iron level regulating protein YaaA (DUF328/UPF0246 family) [Trueperella bonasi]|uniref:Cytoplasmic iron level regulating protein YaaA (DUF328/UPF0246 family) n=1 Tax=Trueperella bonasi TaxID=312286 RepID=A0ABT9NI55_9ACTO|nr:peroxide stress protein YaaA [Trueperella bonasi]MDP9807083.1 cytoplasmic iron level regulating protein YaaA (DUF328/UPF0246 family) [Trueperella bonasi]
MLILLPPSAGKTTPESGPELDLASLTGSEHSGLREQIIAELQEVSASADALKILKVGTSIEPEIRAQIDFYEQPCAPAFEVYTGVLFEAARFGELDEAAAARADRAVRIFSGVFGYTGPSDLIPNYRLSMNTKLPRLGNVGSTWKKELEGVPGGENELVVDCRSSEYQVWMPASSADHVTVGAARIKAGKRSVVSHSAKYYRGLLAGALVREPNPPRDAGELLEFAEVLIDSGEVTGVELDPSEGRKPARLTLVEDLG